MVFPQPMSQKNPYFEPLSPSYVENTGLRAPAVGRMPSNLRTRPFLAKIPKHWVWGPVEVVSAKFTGDLKVAHGDSATDEPDASSAYLFFIRVTELVSL